MPKLKEWRNDMEELDDVKINAVAAGLAALMDWPMFKREMPWMYALKCDAQAEVTLRAERAELEAEEELHKCDNCKIMDGAGICIIGGC